MKRLLLVAAVALIITLPAVALAKGHHRHSNHWHHGHTRNTPPPTPAPSVPPVSGGTQTTPPPTTSPSTPPQQGGETTINAYVTGYSYWDNTPPGSADISNPIIHGSAGGVGSYQDPITLAVGHTISGGRDTLDYPAGTRFYLPFLKKYAIVEDTCGDGNTPQNGPCHTGYQGHPWIDIYVGKGPSSNAADQCMDKITDVHPAIINPISTYPIIVGDIASNCSTY